MEEAEHYRCRRIYLKPSDDPGAQAKAACKALANIDGIILAAPHSAHSIHIVYSLNDVSFELVTDLLHELDFQTADSVLLSLRNTIYRYLDENARDEIGDDIADTAEAAEDPADSPEVPQADEEKYWEDYR